MFPFVRLPPEIRGIIYRLLLVADPLAFTVDFTENNTHNIEALRTSAPTRVTTSIMTVSKEVYTEAFPVLYGDNQFHFHLNAHPVITSPDRHTGDSSVALDSSRILPAHVYPLIRHVKVTVSLASERLKHTNRVLREEIAVFATRLPSDSILRLEISLEMQERSRECLSYDRTQEAVYGIRYSATLKAVKNGTKTLATVLEEMARMNSERVLDGLLLLRGVQHVSFGGSVPIRAPYQASFREHVMGSEHPSVEEVVVSTEPHSG